MTNPKIAIDIAANDKTAKGVGSAEQRFSGMTKRMGAGTDKGAARLDNSYLRAGKSIIRSFTQVEKAASKAFGGGSLTGGIVGKVGAIRSVASALGATFGEAGVAGTALEGVIVSVGAAAATTGAVLGAAAIASLKLADGWSKNATQLGNMSRTMGVTTKDLQEFVGAAERIGVGKDAAAHAIGGLSQTLNDARYGRNGAALAILSRLGVQMKLKKNGDVDVGAMLPAIANGIARQGDSGRRTAAQGLGIGLDALPAFAQGGGRLRANMSDIRDRGVEVSDADIAVGNAITRRDTIGGQMWRRQVNNLQTLNARMVKGTGDVSIAATRAVGRGATALGRAAGGLVSALPRSASAAAARRPALGVRYTGGTRSGLYGGTLNESAQDIADLKKTVQTEWSWRAGEQQGRGIIDTILNRQASGHWGHSVAGVVNARSQFSNINGPVAWRDGRHSVADYPGSRVSRRTSAFVDAYLRERAAGARSSVGDNLNYANPNASDRRNLRWINALDGPVLGRGLSVHRHGTTPELDRYRPGEFGVGIPVHVTVEVLDGRSKATVRTGKSDKPAISHALKGER